MPNVTQIKPSNPWEGTFNICLQRDPSIILESRKISSKEEFDTVLGEVNKYNNASETKESDKRIILRG